MPSRRSGWTTQLRNIQEGVTNHLIRCLYGMHVNDGGVDKCVLKSSAFNAVHAHEILSFNQTISWHLLRSTTCNQMSRRLRINVVLLNNNAV
jgi:hypothetical protein